MANLTKNEKYIVDMYVRYFGRAADAATIASYAEDKKTSVILKNIIADADAEKADLDTTEFVNNAFQNLFGRNANTKEMNKYSKVVDQGKDLPINSIVKSAAKADNAVYNNKIAVAKKYAELGGAEKDLDLSKISKGNLIIDLKTVTTLADLQSKIDALPENSNVPSAFDGKTIMLTAGVDTGKDFVGTAKDDTFLATAKANWSVADSIDGGKGVDTLKIIDNQTVPAAFTQTDLEPISATIKNVEIIDIINNAAITADTTSIDGVTHLYTTSTGANNSTAAATTNINATATAAAITVNGGKDVTVVSKTNISDNIAVGSATTAAAGKVSVTSTGGTANTNAQGNIAVTGGTEITVNQYAGNAATTGVDTVGGTVTVTGNASTTTVTVNQTATATGATATPTTAGVVGYTAGTVTIADVNAGTANANTISTVTLKNAGAATVDSNALSTLNLEGTLATVNTTNSSTATTPAVTTLALNLKGATSTGAVTAGAEVTTLNVNSSTTASTLNSLVAAGAKTINISGDAALTVGTLTATATNEVITVTNTAGVTITTALDTDVTFTGGAGVENIKIAGTTKTVDLGAGDDIATISTTTMGAGGSLKGGAGNDTLVVNTNGSDIAGLPQISGFETLRVEGAAAQGSHNAHTFTALEVGTTTAASTFTNVAAGVGLTVLAGPTGGVTVTLANATGTADVFDLTLKSAGNLTAGTVTLTGVETININSVDTDVTAAGVVNANTLTLAATSAKSIVVTGNTDLALTNNTEVLVTSFDASAATGDITYTSANTTISELVTIKGGAGDDILTGTATANDTIIGGAGADTLVYTGRADTFTGGAGNDTFVINNEGTKALYLTITDLTKGDIINVTGMLTAAANGLVDGIAGAKTTLGAAATFDQYLNEAAKADGATANAAVEWFQFEGNTYLVIDNAAANTFTEGTDAVIKITGLVDLTNATTTAATDIITIA